MDEISVTSELLKDESEVKAFRDCLRVLSGESAKNFSFDSERDINLESCYQTDQKT